MQKIGKEFSTVLLSKGLVCLIGFNNPRINSVFNYCACHEAVGCLME